MYKPSIPNGYDAGDRSILQRDDILSASFSQPGLAFATFQNGLSVSPVDSSDGWIMLDTTFVYHLK